MIVLIPKPNGKDVKPISLFPCLLKIMEKIIYWRLRWFIESNALLPSNQIGFRPRSTCSDNLVGLTTYIQGAYIDNALTICAFLGIEGAFDNVVPSILIKDLQRLGVPVKTANFVRNLSNRQVSFICNGALKGPYITLKGTPQGSILRSLLFNLYCADT